MHRALPPSEPPDGERPCCLRLVVGGAQPRGGWHPSAIARLQGFSSGSPAASPHQWSPRMVTTSSMVGRSKPGCSLCPALSFKDLHHPCWGGGRGKSGPASAWAGDPLLPPASGGGSHPPALRRRRPPAMWGKANCCCPARVQHSVLRPGDCGRLHRGVAQHVVRREGGTRVLGRSRSRFVARTGVRTCRCALGRPALAGAVLVGRWPLLSVLRWWQPERVSPPTTPSMPPALRASSSLVLMASSRPPRGDVNEGLPAVAFALGPSLLLSCHPRRSSLSLLQWSAASHPEFVVPQALRCGGCSYPREWNQSSVCNGTLSVGICSLWLSGPEHLGIWA
jgi:hypothetical protein